MIWNNARRLAQLIDMSITDRLVELVLQDDADDSEEII
jgi:hypothetical protein